jgi:hypothetical protein
MVAACSVTVDTKNLLYRTVIGKHKKDQDVCQTMILKRMQQNRFSGCELESSGSEHVQRRAPVNCGHGN